MRSAKVYWDSESVEASGASSEPSLATPGVKRSPNRTKSKRKPSKPRLTRPYRRATLEQALRIPTTLKDKNGGTPWPPSDVAPAVGLSTKTHDFFYMVAASRDFGFTEGSRDSAEIALTEFGRQVVYAESEAAEETRLREALLKIDIFRRVLEYYRSANLPEMKYLGRSGVQSGPIAEDKPVALIRAKGTPPIFDVDNMLRVFECDPNLWPSTVEHERPRLADQIKAAWQNRESSLTFMKILRERKLRGAG